MTTLKEVPDVESPALADRTAANFRWRHGEIPAVEPVPRATASTSAFFMSESIEGLDIGAHFLDRLSAEQRTQVYAAGRSLLVPQGGMVFSQGESHDGVFIIRRGQVRIYYTAPSGREITLAYW